VILTFVLGTLALLSLGLTLWQWAVAFRFPLHERKPTPDKWMPTISLLKPLKGFDCKTAECLESWFSQRYAGEVEILFGLASATDPVHDVVCSLMAAWPKVHARVVVCPEDLGANAKVSTLIQLMRLARHEVIIVSDADVWVPDGFLTEVVAPLGDPAIGLVNCFYRMSFETVVRPSLSSPGGEEAARALNLSSALAMRWEAFAVNADFWSQVLQSQTLKPLDFALGAVMATTREQIKKIGGFEALADYLADDYQLGHRIAQNGGRIALSPVVVACRNAPIAWRDVWAHQLRWARTIRVCQPLPYLFSQLQNGTLWLLLWALSHASPAVVTTAGGCLLARMAQAFYCERKLTRRADLNSLWLAPFKDLLQIVIWALAFFGNHIEWRGRRFQVLRGGKLEKRN